MPLLPWVPGRLRANWSSRLVDIARMGRPDLDACTSWPRRGADTARRCDGAIVAAGKQLVVQRVMTPTPLTYTEERHGP